mmetsp:Transcript_47308/g.71577  ORF Transcript_47308/g.71577 Transcript_47308/m.71577 type:complete len:415 (+) Transcript_47308:126-1370(+)
MVSAQLAPQGYLMYVWNDGFFGGNGIDHSVATKSESVNGRNRPHNGDKNDNKGGNENDRLRRGIRKLPPLTPCPATHPSYVDEDAYPECFDENWDTHMKRKELWGAVRTAVPPERRVTHILLSRVSNIVVDAGPGSSACNAPGTETLKATLREARAPSVGVKVYALFSIDDEAFSEADRVPDVVAWNQYCASCPNEKFDGVAINNERFSTKKCDADGSEEFILNRLWDAKVAAAAGDIKLHFSIGWHWGWCDVGLGILNNIAWGPPGGGPIVTKPANGHFIDIADSVDVQVSWNTPSTMATRATKAGAAYAEMLGKPFWVLAYTNPSDDDCRFTFFPTVGGCTSGDLTMLGLWEAFDQMVDGAFVADPVPAARGGIHYFRGVYSTGLLGWPKLIGPTVIPFLCADDSPLTPFPP